MKHPQAVKWCELGGLIFPEPAKRAMIKSKGIYWLATPFGAICYEWRGKKSDISNLKFVHLNMEAAEQHSNALQAANLQAIKEAI
jgi:hypothetical protein